MSERLEDINVPPRLLSAIRNEVRSTCEQQLNDLWMVVHSLKDSAAGAAAPSPTADGASSAELEQLKDNIKAVQDSLEDLASEQGKFSESVNQEQAKIAEKISQSIEEQARLSRSLEDQAKEHSRWSQSVTEEQARLSRSLDQFSQEAQKKIRGMGKRVLQQISGEMPALPQGLSEKLETVELLKHRSEKLERDLAQVAGAASLLETRFYDLEGRISRRVEALETRSPAAAPMAGAPGADQLSDEALMGQSASVTFLVHDLLKVVLKYEGSDLFLKSNALPYTSLSGELVPIGKHVLSADDCRRLILLSLTLPKRKELLERRSVHQLACWHDTVFRICAYFERDRLSASIQKVATNVPSLEELGMPRALEVLSLEDCGLILVAAPSHSKRHETLTALLQHINANRKVRIFSLEDKIHYEVTDAEALVTQQEIGTDVADAATGLASLKMLQPDAIMVSLVQDASAAGQILEIVNGHCLMLVGVEAGRAVDGLDTFINLVSPERRPWAREVLGRQLRAVVAQSLLPRLDGQGQVLATELFLNHDEETREFLREGQIRFLEGFMERGVGGMYSLPMSLRRLADAGLIKPPSESSPSPEVQERPKSAISSSLRRDRPTSDLHRLEPPPPLPADEPVGPITLDYAMSAPPRPAAGPAATPVATAPPPVAGPPVHHIGPPPMAPAHSAPTPAPAAPDGGDDTLMGWL